ncbi:UNVERIFIED_CONTAM: hypothetical protein FKN15_039097 [Acipenser sinensis]
MFETVAVHSPSELFCIDILRDDAPYCEKDFQIHFGVKCEACHQFITGKVLEVQLFGIQIVRIQAELKKSTGQETNTITPAVHDAAGAIKCLQKERKCTCKVQLFGIQIVRIQAELKKSTGTGGANRYL